MTFNKMCDATMVVMLDDLLVLHHKRLNASNLGASLTGLGESLAGSPALPRQTCLRQVVLLQRSLLPAGSRNGSLGGELYHGAKGYQFLLELICGLHSPLLGETEVLGQFREFYLTRPFSENSWGDFLRQLTADLLRDAKHIRQQYLQRLGHRSYGSQASQWLHGLPVIGVLGAGQLVRELTP